MLTLLARIIALMCLACCCGTRNTFGEEVDRLPSWNEGASKAAIVSFVARVTQKDSPEFVPVEDRIAVFDNDGTLWVEQTNYSQAFFLIERIKALTPKHPEWKTQEPFASVLQGGAKSAFNGDEKAIVELVMATHAGMTTEEFEQAVASWFATAQHPVLKRPYLECIYQPMVELLSYLRENGFKTYIVSGGGIEFMRPWTEKAYGVPPEQVVGSSIKAKFEFRDGKPVIMRLPELDFIDDGPGKPVGINKFIGKRPIAAFGNSDGDLQMLQWTTAGSGARFGLIVHHTDAKREFAYDRDSHVGRLNKALDEAPSHSWTVVDMKSDWKTIFPASARTTLTSPSEHSEVVN